jgi:hypothetical protein
MQTKLSRPVVIGGMLIWFFSGLLPLAAQPLETRSNYMGVDWTGSWSNEANWAAVTPYSAEPFDGLGGEINQISMAHDNNYLYIFFDEGSAFDYAYGNQNIYFDTDLNSATGDTMDFWWWGTSMGGVGAEHSMYGPALWHHGNTAWTGDSVDSSVSNAGNHLIQIHRSRLGNPTSFDWVGRMFGIDDYYPNAGTHDRYIAQPLPTVTAFGRTWTITEAAHRDNPAIISDVAGATNSLTLTGVFGRDTNAITPLTVGVGTKVSYDFAITNQQLDPIGDGLSNWIGDAFGVFSNSGNHPSNANLLSVRTGVAGGDNPPTRIQYNDINLGELGFASLAGYPLENGVHIEWLFTSANQAQVSVFSPDGNTLLGPVYIDEIEQGISNIQGFRFNLWDSEQTLTITNFTVSAALAGDYNSDGKVDAGDYVVWRKTSGSQAAYNTWRANYGNIAGAGLGNTVSPGSVPEPASVAICGLLLAFIAGTRVRKSCHTD